MIIYQGILSPEDMLACTHEGLKQYFDIIIQAESNNLLRNGFRSISNVGHGIDPCDGHLKLKWEVER